MNNFFALVRRLKGLPDAQPATLDGESCGYIPDRVYAFGDGCGGGNGRGNGRGFGYSDGNAYSDGYISNSDSYGNGDGNGTSVNESDFFYGDRYG